MADDKAIKVANKEGGKKGVDLAGMNDMGGVKFFNVVMESANGDLALLDAALLGMNAPVDEAAEERRGGAGHLGKMLLSAGDKTVALLCNIPKELQTSGGYEHVKIGDWMDKLIAAAGVPAAKREDSEEVVKVLIECDTAKEQFPLKIRDAAQAAGFAFLRDNKLIPDDDDSEEYVLDAEAAGIEW